MASKAKISDTFLAKLTKEPESKFFLVLTTNGLNEEEMKNKLLEMGVKMRHTFNDDFITFSMEATGAQALKVLDLEFVVHLREMVMAQVC